MVHLPRYLFFWKGNLKYILPNYHSLPLHYLLQRTGDICLCQGSPVWLCRKVEAIGFKSIKPFWMHCVPGNDAKINQLISQSINQSIKQSFIQCMKSEQMLIIHLFQELFLNFQNHLQQILL